MSQRPGIGPGVVSVRPMSSLVSILQQFTVGPNEMTLTRSLSRGVSLRIHHFFWRFLSYLYVFIYHWSPGCAIPFQVYRSPVEPPRHGTSYGPADVGLRTTLRSSGLAVSVLSMPSRPYQLYWTSAAAATAATVLFLFTLFSLDPKFFLWSFPSGLPRGKHSIDYDL